MSRGRGSKKGAQSPDQGDLFSLMAPVKALDEAPKVARASPVPRPDPAARERPRSRPRVESEVPLKMISVASALLRYGIGRTKFYELVGRGHVKTVKLGAKTLVDVLSGDAYFDALPSRGCQDEKPMSERR